MSQPKDALVAKIEREWNLIRGRILGLIESWGLPDRQENGAKASFKALSYDAEARIAELVADDALRQSLTAVAEGIAELERCRDLIASEQVLADDPSEFDGVRSFLVGRLEELQAHRRDLLHLERIRQSLGGNR